MSYLTHHQGLQNVHELNFLEANRRACEYFLGLLANSYQCSDEKPHILLDMRQSGLLPLAYLGRELQSLLKNYPQHPNTQLALVLENSQSIKLCQFFLAPSLRNEKVQYFTEIDSARSWLLHD